MPGHTETIGITGAAALTLDVIGLNVIGLKRRGVSEDTIRTLKRAYRLLFHSDGSRAHAVLKTRQAFSNSTEVAALVDFVEGSNRGVCRP